MSGFIVFSDIHIHRWPAYSSISTNGSHSRLDDTLRALDEILGASKKMGAPAIFAGDLFHRPKADAEVYNRVYELISERCAQGVGFYYVTGNHDQLERGSRQFAMSDSLQRINWCHRVTEKFRDGIQGMDYTDDPRAQIITRTMKNKPTVFVCHQGIVGAEVSEDFNSDFDFDIPMDLTQKMASKIVIAGHYHRPQYYDDPGKVKVLIPGAPIQHTWGDEGQRRGFWHIPATTKSGKIEAEFYELTGYPKFVTLDLNDMERRNAEVKDADVKGNFVRVVGPRELIEKRLEMIRYTRDLARFVELSVEVDPLRQVEQRLKGATAKDSPAQLAKRYVDQCCEEPLRRETESLGLEILKEAEQG